MLFVRPLRRFGPLLVLAVGALLAGFAAGRAHAQSEPLRPGALRGALVDDRATARPGMPARKPKPGEKPQRVQFGNPPGSGAAETGFISTNVPRPKRKKAAPRPPLVTPSPLLRGAILPSRRRGASLDPPLTTATPLIRRRAPELDPFDAVGIHAGSFILRPAIEAYVGHDSNAERIPNGRSSWYTTLAPELVVRSDWNRHALNAEIRGSYTEYQQVSALSRPFLDARVNGRIDITTRTRAELEAREYVTTTYPGSPDLPAGVAKLPLYTTTGATASMVHQFNRFELALKGAYDRVVYQDAQLTDGTTVSSRDRNYDQYSTEARVSYDVTPGVKPFIDVQADTRRRDLPVDAYGLQRDSVGWIGKIGTTFELSRILTGEMSVGYLQRTYQDPTLPDLHGLVLDGALVWVATGLTTAKLSAKSSGDETTLPGVAGVLRRDLTLQVDHAFRRWLIGTAKIGYGLDDYQGSTRYDRRSLASLGLTYKLNREWQVRSEVRRETLRSTVGGVDYTSHVGLLGLRFQR